MLPGQALAMVSRHWLSLNRWEIQLVLFSLCCSWARVSHGVTPAGVVFIMAIVTFFIELLCPPRFSITGQLSLVLSAAQPRSKRAVSCMSHVLGVFSAVHFSSFGSQLPAPSQSSNEDKHYPLAVSATKHHTHCHAGSPSKLLISSPFLHSLWEWAHPSSCHEEEWLAPAAGAAQMKPVHDGHMSPACILPSLWGKKHSLLPLPQPSLLPSRLNTPKLLLHAVSARWEAQAICS